MFLLFSDPNISLCALYAVLSFLVLLVLSHYESCLAAKAENTYASLTHSPLTDSLWKWRLA